MLTALLSLLSPSGRHARLSVLIFHRVLPARDELFPDEVDAVRFDALCAWTKALFNVLPLDEAMRRRARAALPPRALAITFDDGYRDNHDIALPILLRHGLTATFFIATGYLAGGRMFNDSVIEAVRCSPLQEADLRPLGVGELGTTQPLALRTAAQRRRLIEDLLCGIKYRPAAERELLGERLAELLHSTLPGNLMMRPDHVRALQACGMQIGAHTVTHPILANLADDEASEELESSKRFLEQLLGARIGLFAYPNGKPETDFSHRTVELVREAGFDAAFTTAWGAARAGDDPFRMPRFTPWDLDRSRFALRMARNLVGQDQRGAARAAYADGHAATGR